MKTELEEIANAFDELVGYVTHENGMKLRAAICDAMAKCATTERKIIQIAEGGISGMPGLHGSESWTMALCNDGSVWSFYKNKWERLPSIPQEAS